jgi:phospholipase C
MRIPKLAHRALAAAAASVLASLMATGVAFGEPSGPGDGPGSATATPIRHLVVIIGENESFDHYFGTYPHAANTDGQPFHAAHGTPAVDGLPPAASSSLPPALRRATDLLTDNPNTAAGEISSCRETP